jgi:hypothetical protein
VELLVEASHPVGRCHRPNSAAVVITARIVDHRRNSKPSSTPRNASSSSSTVPIGMTMIALTTIAPALTSARSSWNRPRVAGTSAVATVAA